MNDMFEAKNIQLICKNREVFFLCNLTKDDIQRMGRPQVIFLGNKYGTIGLDKENKITTSQKNMISDFASNFIKENIFTT